MWGDKWLAAQNLQPHLQPDECGDCLGVSQVSHSVTFPIWPKGKEGGTRVEGEASEGRVEKTTQSDKVTLTQLSARSSLLPVREAGKGTRRAGGESEWPLIEIEFTQLQVFIGVLLLPPPPRGRGRRRASPTVVAGDASGGRADTVAQSGCPLTAKTETAPPDYRIPHHATDAAQGPNLEMFVFPLGVSNV